MSSSNLDQLRSEYHKQICKDILGLRTGPRISTQCYSNADTDNRSSRDISSCLAERLPYEKCGSPPSGGESGKLFTAYTRTFLEASFKLLVGLRPGDFVFPTVSGQVDISGYSQYEHLAYLKELISKHEELGAALNDDYRVTPDIVMARRPIDRSDPGLESLVESKDIARLTPLIAESESAPLILHASISCKWTVRSDRSQNIRTEALNLIRNRKGNMPHFAAVTLEPLPTRIASVAKGTGEVDCTYHAALYELIESVEEVGNTRQKNELRNLVDAGRLRDISDLPFDLAT